jgi:hypothetical protein
MKNIEVSGELDMGEKSYDDLTFLILTQFFHVWCALVCLGVPWCAPVKLGNAAKLELMTYRLT